VLFDGKKSVTSIRCDRDRRLPKFRIRNGQTPNLACDSEFCWHGNESEFMKPGSSLLKTSTIVFRHCFRWNLHGHRRIEKLEHSRHLSTSPIRYSSQETPRTKRTPPSTAEMAATAVNKTAHPFDKIRLDALLNRRFFYAPAFEIYGGMCLVSRIFNVDLTDTLNRRRCWLV
jgi:hypothetical protein